MSRRHPIASKIVSWMCGLVALPLSIVPFYAYTRYDGTGRILALEVVRHFQGPPTGSLSAADATRYRVQHQGYRNGLAVLAFGGVMDGDTADGPTPESTTLPVARFADDLRMLAAAGYHTVTPAQVAAWKAGRAALPDDALLLTFDGGRADTVLNAAPVVRALRLKATVFVTGGAYRQAPVYYASPSQLRGLQSQGWAIGAYAISGHATVSAGHGRKLPFLAARKAQHGGLEPLPRFAARVAAEYTSAKRAAEQIAHARVIAYAWPYGAYGADSRTNDRRTAAINLRAARARFALGFDDDGQDGYALATRAGDPMRIGALRVSPDETPSQLFTRLELAIAASGQEVGTDA
jgi:peptidoglycan/xylan/chitin deacetylase (PgdA/CDA1 family)